jgi:ferritin-like metal-binding protein YciE
MSNSLKFVYQHIPVEEKIYNSYEEFIKDFYQKEEKALKQLYIIKERLQYAEIIIQEFREKVEKEIEGQCKQVETIKINQ